MEETNLASPAQHQPPNTTGDAEITNTYSSSTGSPADDSDNSQLLIGESLIPERERKHAGTTVVTIDGLLKDPLRLKEDLKNGCGGQLWPAGLLLSRYMLEEHATDLVGKTIVEIGAGGGLVGLAVARGCQTDKPIYITDQEPMMQLMRDNISLNDLSMKVKPALLDWARPPPAEIPEHPELVLAADCVYFEPAFPLLISTLQRLLGPDTICYFCFKRRRRADLRCIKMIKKLFHVTEITKFSTCDGYNRENLFLYKIQSRQHRD
ncbi:conserved hypothetical protein [Talaromyces stipitatus ATCC 10500]|uniref:Protein-lysine N-methyltransferase EFM6 n=1 Tax=Talaromyces stipitatus (strain ATCC 10500 / CBS 375.48 / QM 6759 / NRRL 1006) TaxID=441959 RepID=B8LTP5_TALSN|nr:uncharacterized protein TSTA_070470 [Talaromyces stipitatus ATCC 10500]EED23637.1 conserved hypothetical protein [Talaromyces stipitatus ATCC 10500]